MDETLITRAQAGDRDALAELLRCHDAVLRGQLAGKMAPVYASALDIDDVLQITYLEVFLNICQFESSAPGSFRAWVAKSAENNLRDAIRELDREKRPPRDKQVSTSPSDDSYVEFISLLGGSVPTPSRQVARREAKTLLDRAIGELPEDYRTVVTMMDLDGRPGKDVGEAMGRKLGAVYMMRCRAHERLKTILGSSSQFFSR